ncbi:MAG: L,D-transpeptidase family protein [Actinomycetota bacterium]
MSDTNDIVSRRRFWSGRRLALVLAVLVGLMALGAGGAAYATYQYSQKYAGRILPGTSVAGMPVGGMTTDEALEVVREAIEPQLNRTITLSWKDKTWKVTPKELGAKNDAETAVAAALRVSADASFFDKMRMRLFDEDLDYSREVAITYPRQGARGFVKGIASSLDRDARDAAIDSSTGWVEISSSRTGREVKAKKGLRALMRSLPTGKSQVELPVRMIEPEVTGDDFDEILLVRIGENRLYMYEGGKITRSWPVATGQPEYMTPTGVFEIELKRFEPTWVNPDPEGWGASLPEVIPAGPSNPLGLRALNWSAPLIRFHGTTATYSLGYNASHGCVRLSNADAIELYDLVDVGTPIVSVIAGELKPLYASSDPDPTVVDEAAGERVGSGDNGSGGDSSNSDGKKKDN